LRTIFCKITKEFINSQRCVPEDKKCLSCPHRRIRSKKAGPKNTIKPIPLSEVEKVFQKKVIPELNKRELFSSLRPYRGRIAADSYRGKIRNDPYRLPRSCLDSQDFSRFIITSSNEDAQETVSNGFEQRLINCSKRFLQSYDLFKDRLKHRWRPFPWAEKLCKALLDADKCINESFSALSPWLEEESCELIEQIRAGMEKLSSHIKNEISPGMGGKTRPEKWPQVRYAAELAQLYEMTTGEEAKRKDPVLGTTGDFFKFATICFKNLGFNLSKDQIDSLVRKYHKTRHSSVFHPW